MAEVYRRERKRVFYDKEKILSVLQGQSMAICPECNKPMMLLATKTAQPPKPEAYCEPCHYSIPLFRM